MTETPLESLRLATEIAGGQSALARLLGVSQAAVWKWLSRGVDLPAEHVLPIEEATNVSRHNLRPDIYPREPGATHVRTRDPRHFYATGEAR